MKKIYTHDEAARLVDAFDEVLSQHNIHVPSPEDDEREEDSMVGLYGSTYSDLLDYVENKLVDIIGTAKTGAEVVVGEFSGNY